MTREGKSNWERARDMASFVMSAIAFLVSIVIAYFNFVRQEDNLSIIFREKPLLMRLDDESLTTRWGELSVILINNGNRPAVVSKVSLLVHEYDRESGYECDYNAAVTSTFETDFEPIVVKEKEVTFKKININSTSVSRSQKKIEKVDVTSYRTTISDKNKGQSKLPVEVCVQVFLSTPSLSDYRVNISLERQDVVREWVSVGGYEAEPPRPHKLLRELGTILRQH